VTKNRDVLKRQTEAVAEQYSRRGYELRSDIANNYHMLYREGRLVWECQGLYPLKAALSVLTAREVK